jgi:hypothetical protein
LKFYRGSGSFQKLPLYKGSESFSKKIVGSESEVSAEFSSES